MSYKHILVSTDGSEPALRGIDATIDLAKAAGAKLTAVHVSQPYPAFDLATSMGLLVDQTSVTKYYETVDSLADEILSKVSARAEKAGVDIKTRYVQRSRASDGILKTAESENCDLIVISSKGATGLERLVMGSIANDVASRGKVSVLVAR